MDNEQKKKIQSHLDAIQALLTEEKEETSNSGSNGKSNKLALALEKIELEGKVYAKEKGVELLGVLIEKSQYPLTGSFFEVNGVTSKKYDPIDIEVLFDKYFVTRGWKCTFEDLLDYIIAGKDIERFISLVKSGADIKLLISGK